MTPQSHCPSCRHPAVHLPGDLSLISDYALMLTSVYFTRMDEPLLARTVTQQSKLGGCSAGLPASSKLKKTSRLPIGVRKSPD